MYARAREDLAEYQAGEIVKIADNQELERRQSEVRGKTTPHPPCNVGRGPSTGAWGRYPTYTEILKFLPKK